MATSSPPAGHTNHRPITHGVGTSPITPPIPNNSLPITDDDRAAASNSLPPLTSDAPNSIKPMKTPRSTADSCVQLHTPNKASLASLDAFHYFPKLAPELRLKIWKDVLPDACIVEVEVFLGPGHTYKWWASAESKNKPCGLLLASKESRYVYLEHWLPLFRYVPLNVKFSKDEDGRHQMFSVDVLDSRFPLCYFNPRIDMLYLGPYNSHPIDSDRVYTFDGIPFANREFESLAAIPALQQLRRLGCQHDEWAEVANNYPTYHFNNIHKNFLLLPSLEEFTIGFGDVGWESMNFRGKTKPSGEIELAEILPYEWVMRDDENYPDHLDWWWGGIKESSPKDWQAPSFSWKRILRGGVSPQQNLTGWDESDEAFREQHCQIDELQTSTDTEE